MTRPRHDGMPPQGPEFAEFLRRELHAAADQLEPRPDGLERIRARVSAGPAYASKHSAATGVSWPTWSAAGTPRAAGRTREGAGERQQRDWRYGLLRPALAAACAVFAIGVALAIPPLRQAFVQLGSAVGISSSSTGGGAPSLNGSGTQYGAAAGGVGQGGTSAAQSSGQVTACPSSSPSSTEAKSATSAKPVTPSASPAEPGEQPAQPTVRAVVRAIAPRRRRDRDRYGDGDKDREHRHRHGQGQHDGFGEGQHERDGRQADRQGDRDTLPAQLRPAVHDGQAPGDRDRPHRSAAAPRRRYRHRRVRLLRAAPAPARQTAPRPLRAPGRPTPGQPPPGQPAPGRPAPGQPAPGRPAVPGRPAPSQAAPARPAPPVLRPRR